MKKFTLLFILMIMASLFVYQKHLERTNNANINQMKAELQQTRTPTELDVHVMANDSIPSVVFLTPGSLTEWEYFMYLFIQSRVYSDSLADSTFSTYIWGILKLDSLKTYSREFAQ